VLEGIKGDHSVIMEPTNNASDAAAAPKGPGMVLRSPFQRKQDVFDSEDFSAVKLINQLYPDGADGVVLGVIVVGV
jgi:hypothetical protein